MRCAVSSVAAGVAHVVADGADDPSDIRVVAEHGGLHQGRVDDGAGDAERRCLVPRPFDAHPQGVPDSLPVAHDVEGQPGRAPPAARRGTARDPPGPFAPRTGGSPCRWCSGLRRWTGGSASSATHHARSSRSRSRGTATSVQRKQRRVAMFGSIMPGALRDADDPPAARRTAARTLGNASVVMMARAIGQDRCAGQARHERGQGPLHLADGKLPADDARRGAEEILRRAPRERPQRVQQRARRPRRRAACTRWRSCCSPARRGWRAAPGARGR